MAVLYIYIYIYNERSFYTQVFVPSILRVSINDYSLNEQIILNEIVKYIYDSFYVAFNFSRDWKVIIGGSCNKNKLQQWSQMSRAFTGYAMKFVIIFHCVGDDCEVVDNTLRLWKVWYLWQMLQFIYNTRIMCLCVYVRAFLRCILHIVINTMLNLRNFEKEILQLNEKNLIKIVKSFWLISLRCVECWCLIHDRILRFLVVREIRRI